MAKRRLIVVLRGGLGNQLFQYASCRALSLRVGAQPVLDPYSGFSDDIYGRGYQLHNFRIAAEVLDQDKALWARRRHNVQRELGWRVEHLYFRCFNSYYMPSVLGCLSNGTLGRDLYVMEYLQSYRYFQHIAPVLLEELAPARPLNSEQQRLADAILEGASASVHLRRPHALGPDGRVITPAYIGTELHGDYYRAAANYIRRKAPGIRFFIFSDDPDAGERLAGVFGSESAVVHVDAGDACVDLFLMSLCQHNIIANSTFSWWGAWLNRWPDKTVCAPARWYTGPVPRDFYPPGWLVL